MLAEKIDRAGKYYSDIERGFCGMSVETMLALSKNLDISLDYMIFGKESDTVPNTEPEVITLEPSAADLILEQCTEREYTYALRMLELFVEAVKNKE